VFRSKRKKRGLIISLIRGDCLFCLLIFLIVIVWELGFVDVRKCTDEEHIIYSGGKEIKDLLQCG
jgi:hypothetical protein